MHGTHWNNPNFTPGTRSSKNKSENAFDYVYNIQPADETNILSNIIPLTNVNPYVSLFLFQNMGNPMEEKGTNKVKALLDTLSRRSY
jgi:hypothetical protein